VVRPAFQLAGQSYGQFETPEYILPKSLDNLMISVDIEKSAQAVVRSYVRIKFATTGLWTRFSEFEGEFHYADPRAISAYQLQFVVRDDSLGQTSIPRFTVQGRQAGEDAMIGFLAKPNIFKSNKAWAKPPIISRQEWGARPPKSSYTSHKVQRIVLHHSWIPNQSQYKGAASIRGIQSYHMDGDAHRLE
jgi:hypothetical protein